MLTQKKSKTRIDNNEILTYDSETVCLELDGLVLVRDGEHEQRVVRVHVFDQPPLTQSLRKRDKWHKHLGFCHLCVIYVCA